MSHPFSHKQEKPPDTTYSCFLTLVKNSFLESQYLIIFTLFSALECVTVQKKYSIIKTIRKYVCFFSQFLATPKASSETIQLTSTWHHKLIILVI